MRVLLTAAMLLAAISLGSPAAFADNCTWFKQTDGSTWGTCVDDNGRMYCQSCPADGGKCQVVSCSS